MPANDLQEFIAYAKAKADKLNMGHAGVGSITHFTCLLLNSIIGIHPALVPFTGSAPAVNALIAGHIDYLCDPTPDIVQQLKAGTLRVYAIASSERSPILPDVPTTKESDLPEFQVTSWYALFAPKGTPKAILDNLTAALDAALDDESVIRRLRLGCDIPDKGQRGQQPLASLVKTEIARWTPIIKAANLRAE